LGRQEESNFNAGYELRSEYDISVCGSSPTVPPEQAQPNFKYLENSGWLTGYANVWSVSLSSCLNADYPDQCGAAK
jgi:hypothetical protein